MGVEFVGRGCAKYDQHLNREPGVFVVAAGEFFSFRPDWHQDDRAGPLVRQYQTTLDAILRDDPGLASCAVHCRHCGIRFLTHPRNANRRNLHCPFGCREHHRRHQANERSRKLYRTEQGCRKKKALNGKRSAVVSQTRSPGATVSFEASPGDKDVSSTEASPAEATAHASPDPARQATAVKPEGSLGMDVKLILDGFTLDEATLVNSPMLPYLTMVASLIERREIHCEELLEALLRSMRQRSFDRLPRREYVLRFLDRHPP